MLIEKYKSDLPFLSAKIYKDFRRYQMSKLIYWDTPPQPQLNLDVRRLSLGVLEFPIFYLLILTVFGIVAGMWN
ncbi:MAG: hypothetical protein HC877_11695 [Thioploca sp.]|nr:hypothetical protein [Thioploca sp.]